MEATSKELTTVPSFVLKEGASLCVSFGHVPLMVGVDNDWTCEDGKQSKKTHMADEAKPAGLTHTTYMVHVLLDSAEDMKHSPELRKELIESMRMSAAYLPACTRKGALIQEYKSTVDPAKDEGAREDAVAVGDPAQAVAEVVAGAAEVVANDTEDTGDAAEVVADAAEVVAAAAVADKPADTVA